MFKNVPRNVNYLFLIENFNFSKKQKNVRFPNHGGGREHRLEIIVFLFFLVPSQHFSGFWSVFVFFFVPSHGFEHPIKKCCKGTKKQKKTFKITKKTKKNKKQSLGALGPWVQLGLSPAGPKAQGLPNFFLFFVILNIFFVFWWPGLGFFDFVCFFLSFCFLFFAAQALKTFAFLKDFLFFLCRRPQNLGFP